jgi:hypothetical protein
LELLNKKDYILGTGSTQEGMRNVCKYWSQELKGIDYLEDHYIEGKIILK